MLFPGGPETRLMTSTPLPEHFRLPVNAPSSSEELVFESAHLTPRPHYSCARFNGSGGIGGHVHVWNSGVGAGPGIPVAVSTGKAATLSLLKWLEAVYPHGPPALLAFEYAASHGARSVVTRTVGQILPVIDPMLKPVIEVEDFDSLRAFRVGLVAEERRS